MAMPSTETIITRLIQTSPALTDHRLATQPPQA